MIRLRFPLTHVKAVADHAIAATSHRPSYTESVDGLTPKPALFLVADQGIYVMSNGLPSQPDPGRSDGRSLVVHAEGCATVEAKHALRPQIGGDDFCEVLPLLARHPGGGNLYQEITEGVAANCDYLLVAMDTTTIGYSVSAPAEPAANRGQR